MTIPIPPPSTSSLSTADKINRAQALFCAKMITNKLAYTLGVNRAGNRTGFLESPLAEAFDRDRRLTPDLDRSLRQSFDLALPLTYDLEHPREDVSDLVLLGRAADLAGTLQIALERAHDPLVIRAVSPARSYAFTIHRYLERAVAAAENESVGRRNAEKTKRVAISPVAKRLTSAAVCCLPLAQQARYREEYHAELREMAAASRSAQWRYGLNVLTCAWLLRRELHKAERQPAVRRWLG